MGLLPVLESVGVANLNGGVVDGSGEGGHMVSVMAGQG